MQYCWEKYLIGFDFDDQRGRRRPYFIDDRLIVFILAKMMKLFYTSFGADCLWCKLTLWANNNWQKKMFFLNKCSTCGHNLKSNIGWFLFSRFQKLI